MQRFDLFLLSIVFILALIGILLIFVATYKTPQFFLFTKQAIFLLVGVGVMLVALKIPMRIHYALAHYYLGFAVLMFIVLLFQADGVRRWFRLGGLAFQPSEFAKLAWIFFLARYFDERKRDIDNWRTPALPLVLFVGILTLLIYQPDLGTGLLFGALFLGILWWAGFSGFSLFLLISPIISLLAAFNWVTWAIYFFLLIIALYVKQIGIKKSGLWIAINTVFGLITPFAWMRLYDYQRRRILVFLDPGRDPFGAGYQVLQSKIAIGSGNIAGKGIVLTEQPGISYLPARTTDFIFAVLGKSFGLMGCLIVLVLFFLLIWRGIAIASNARNYFNRLVAFGITLMITIQVIVNILMSVGYAPVTGIPLPFLTYGGSSLLTFLFAIGLLLKIEEVE